MAVQDSAAQACTGPHSVVCRSQQAAGRQHSVRLLRRSKPSNAEPNQCRRENLSFLAASRLAAFSAAARSFSSRLACRAVSERRHGHSFAGGPAVYFKVQWGAVCSLFRESTWPLLLPLAPCPRCRPGMVPTDSMINKKKHTRRAKADERAHNRTCFSFSFSSSNSASSAGAEEGPPWSDLADQLIDLVQSSDRGLRSSTRRICNL